MKILRYIGLALAGIILSVSCTDDREWGTDIDESLNVPAVLDATINDMERPSTRHNVDKNTDSWTTTSFVSGDQVGLFATSGLVDSDGNIQLILNKTMTYEKASGSSNYRFRNDGLVINTGLLGRAQVGKYVYYPYSDEMPNNVVDLSLNDGTPNATTGNYYILNDYDQDHPGLYLRERGEDGILRCIDYMYISNISLSNGSLSGGFSHGFCELIVVRGDGFKEVPDEYKDHIWVVLTNGYTRLRLRPYFNNTTGIYYWYPQLYYPDSEKYNLEQELADGLTKDEAKRWQMWKGKPYIDTDENGYPFEREAWYAIMPSAHGVLHPTIDYIEIYDDAGKPQKVSNFVLYTDANGINDKNMHPGYRFALEIMMSELGAIARPHEIVEWVDEDPVGPDGQKPENDSHDITDERTAGIGSATEFEEWRGAYVQYLINEYRPKTIEEFEEYCTNNSTSPLANLRKYGDYNINNSEGVWTFYITQDIDASNIGPIDKLYDILEGVNKVSNYTISNLKHTFIGEIRENGAVKRLDFDNLYIRVSSEGGYNGTAGALTNRLNGGTIENCNVDGTIISTTSNISLGMLCGTVETDSTVSDCSAAGAIIGATSGSSDSYADGLFGKVNGTIVYGGRNSTDGLIIKPL